MARKENLVFIFSLAIIIVCLVILFSRFTGFASSVADLNVSVTPTVNLNFTIDTIDFGTGQVDPGKIYAIIDSVGNIENGTWIPPTQGFVLQNIGNTNISVDLKTDKSADDFIGGSSPGYLYNVTNVDAGACTSSISLGLWYGVNTSSPGTRICDKFMYSVGKNRIRTDVRLAIPFDSKKGAQTDIFTATGTIA